MTFEFDWQNKIIEVPSPVTTVEIQDLINEIRYAEATVSGIKQPQIANAAGKEELAPGVVVGITINLLDNWQLHFWPGNYTATVQGGNLVGGLAGDPISYSAGVQVLLIQSASATIVTTGGSALTQAEHDQLFALPDETAISSDVWTYPTRTLTQEISVSGGGLTQEEHDFLLGLPSATETASGVWTYNTRELTQALTVSGGGLTQEEHDHLLGLDTSALSAMQTSIEDALGVAGENTKWSGMAFDANNNLISAVITQYTDDTLSVERKKWQLTANYDAQSRITNYEFKEY
jgi:hypothetical protein